MIKIKNNNDYLANLTRILCNPDFHRALPDKSPAPLLKAPTRLRSVASAVDSKAVCAKTLAELRELFAAGQKGVKRGLKIPFTKICVQKRFDEIESAAFALFAVAEISGRDQFEIFRGAENIFKSLAGLFGMEKVRLAPYFLSSGKLRKSGVFSCGHYMQDDAFRLPSNLREKIIEKLLTGDKKSLKKKNKVVKILRPGSISERLGLNVIAQEAAKRQLSTVAFQHLQRAKTPVKSGLAAPRLNTLLIGPTGCGKTYITKCLAEILGVPVAFCDATQYTETGYAGACVEDMLVQLQTSAGDNPKAAEYGIIFIDEIDKIRAESVGQSHNSNRDVSGLSVQQDLLKILEGDKLNYEKYRTRCLSEYSFNVKNVLFIAAGAFQGLVDIVNDRIKTKRQIGFNDQATLTNGQPEQVNLLQQVRPQDIIKYGFMPELIGRFPNVIALDRLTREDFLGILDNPRTSLVEYYRDFFNKHGVELEIPPEFYGEISANAIDRDLGARGLNAAVEGFFSGLVFDLLKFKKAGERQKVNIMDYTRGGHLKELFG
ncbi:MAG TPA: hypothetical protein DCL44_11415 [Elusimicrobia bacterium]|nr:hypothetical protein [Elusimicrobiota bacterium]